MSVSSISQLSDLGDDVLLMIFQQLEGEDLVNCEVVCRQWRDILVTGTPWRRLFLRNKENLPLWRKAQRILEFDQLTLRTDQYRNVCKSVIQGKRNWRTGNYTTVTCSTNRPDSFTLTIGENHVAWNALQLWQTYEKCVFLDTESMEIKEIPLYYSYNIMNGILFVGIAIMLVE
jgi:F-box-like